MSTGDYEFNRWSGRGELPPAVALIWPLLSPSGPWTTATGVAAHLRVLQRTGLRPHPVAAVRRAHSTGRQDHRKRGCRHRLLPLRLHHWPYIPYAHKPYVCLCGLLDVCTLQPLWCHSGNILTGDERKDPRGNWKIFRTQRRTCFWKRLWEMSSGLNDLWSRVPFPYRSVLRRDANRQCPSRSNKVVPLLFMQDFQSQNGFLLIIVCPQRCKVLLCDFMKNGIKRVYWKFVLPPFLTKKKRKKKFRK